MRAIVVQIGQHFGRLTVLREAGRGVRGGQPVRRFLCGCECGQETTVVLSDLRRGDTASCGCFGNETRAAAVPPVTTTHGYARDDGTALPEYKIWQAMKDRCGNPRNRFYAYYGGRGITVCTAWQVSFVDFLEHVGRRPSKDLQIDRIDNDRGYEPGNVRWATKAQQMANRRPYRKRL